MKRAKIERPKPTRPRKKVYPAIRPDAPPPADLAQQRARYIISGDAPPPDLAQQGARYIISGGASPPPFTADAIEIATAPPMPPTDVQVIAAETPPGSPEDATARTVQLQGHSQARAMGRGAMTPAGPHLEWSGSSRGMPLVLQGVANQAGEGQPQPAEILEAARNLAKEFKNQADELRAAKPNDPARLDSYDDLLAFFEKMAAGLASLADALEQAFETRGDSSQPEPILLGNAAKIARELQACGRMDRTE
jgi:hypothetical protein